VFKKSPTIYQLRHLVDYLQNNPVETGIKVDDKELWVPARPVGYPSLCQNIKAAWLVLTGKADVVIWPGTK